MRGAVIIMGRVLIGATLAALILTAGVTVHESNLEMRRGADHAALVAQKERLKRIRAELIELKTAASSLQALTVRARDADLPLRIPGLPEIFTSGARDRPQDSSGLARTEN